MTDILQWFVDLFSNWQFWAILLAVTILAWTVVAKFFKRINLNKGKVMLISIIALFLAVGGASMLGVGTVGVESNGGVVISGLQTTTAYVMSGVGGDLADSTTDNTKSFHVYGNETHMAGNAYVNKGVFQVTRSGDLEATSCPVTVYKPPRYDISDTTYHIVDEDANTGVMYAYVHTASSSGVATSADPKEKNQLAFAEGVAVGYVAFNITIDETGFDPLTQYDTKTIHTNVCGYPFAFVIHKGDA